MGSCFWRDGGETIEGRKARDEEEEEEKEKAMHE